MNSLSLAAFAARAHDLCEALHARPDDDNNRHALLGALAEMTKIGPDKPERGSRTLIMGLFNQARMFGDVVEYRTAQYGKLPSPEALGASRRSLIDLKVSLSNLRAALTASEGRV